ncbi:MAG: SUMF1/EgtB/PvdO family nonheme iron enzyme [Anaerolineae bacterium]
MPTSFDETTWRSRIAAWWRETARDPAGTMQRLGVHTAYGLLTASAWLPLLAAYAEDPGPAVAALAGVLSGVGTNLLSNLLQETYERATAPQRAEQEVAERPDLRAEYQRMLARLEVLTAAQGALGERWADFEAQLREELAHMGGGLRVETGGSAVVFGDVVAYEFVGRDKTIITVRGERVIVVGGDAHGLIAVTGDGSRVYVSPDQVPPEAAYLRALARECQRLPLVVVDPRFLQTGPETPVPLPEVYVDLDVVAPVREERRKGERVFITRLARGEGRERAPLLEAIAHPEVARFVLLGDPGSGKTTFVNYLAYTPAVGAQQATPLRGMFPVRLALREVAARCIPPGAEEGQARMLWKALRADLTARLGEEGAKRLFPHLQRRLLEEGGLVLLDGLDEVPQAERRRKCLLEAVADLAGTLPPERSRVLVTARLYAYDKPQWRLPGFEVLLLADFDGGQVERFVERWYQAVRPTMGWDEPTARGRGERLLSALEERPRLAALADILWVEIPPGPFLMGSAEDDETAYDDEKPQHTLDLPAFYLSRYPITDGQYRPFAEGGGYDEPRYWTEEGWAWRTGEQEPDFSPLDDWRDEEEWKKSYIEWVTGRRWSSAPGPSGGVIPAGGWVTAPWWG